MAISSSISNGTLGKLVILRGKSEGESSIIKRISSIPRTNQRNISRKSHTSTQKCSQKKKKLSVTTAIKEGIHQINVSRRKNLLRKRSHIETRKERSISLIFPAVVIN